MVAGLATPESIVNPDQMFADNGIELIKDRVQEVDSKNKRVQLSQGRELEYDKLVLSTGSKPIIPPIPGSDLEGVFTLRSLADAERIREYMQEKNPKKLVLVGSGFISLESSTLLLESHPTDFQAEVIEFLDQPLPLMLDSEMGEQVYGYLQEQGLSMRMGQKVEKILGQDGWVSKVELSTGEQVDADMVFLNVGAKPNLELAEKIGLEMGQFGIQVNEYLETSDPDILAGGDCVNNKHFITGKPTPIQLRGPAVIQGRYIAKRLAGYDFPFPGLLGNSMVRLFGKYISATGFTESAAKQEGFDPVCATVKSRSKHGMIPGVQPWQIKLVFDRASQRLLGGQIISDSEGPVKEIDTVNALILGHKTAQDLTTLMCAGNPDNSSEPSLEPISIAGEQALQKIRG
ncbi:MAG: FAD-dependent oxidoreductase [Thermodesulfobacteriota bacterium]